MEDDFNKKLDDILIQLIFESAGASGALDKKGIVRVIDESRRQFAKHRKNRSSPQADDRIIEILEKSLAKGTPGYGDITKLFDTLGILYEVIMDQTEADSVRVAARG